MSIKYITLAVSLVLIGCSAALVPETSDPNQKIHQAYELLSTYRPIPARRLIDESIQIYKQNGDDEGLAYAYTASTDYYRYVSSEEYAKYIKNYESSLSGVKPLPLYAVLFKPMSKQAMEESKKSEETHRKVIAKAITDKDYFKASNNYYQLFVLFARNNQKSEACESLQQTLKQNEQGKKLHPEFKVAYNEKKFSSFNEQIEAELKSMKCKE